MSYRIKLCLILILLFSSAVINSAEGLNRLRNSWEVGFTFGEIPMLSGSFKPGITLGYHLNEYISLSASFQLRDHLERNEESFNAQNMGFDGLLSSKETTGERVIFAVNLRPSVYSPFLVAGIVYNNIDQETIKFDSRKRKIGDNEYLTGLSIIQSRKSGIVPAVGIGYRYDFDNGISLNTSFAMGFFNEISAPENRFESDIEILPKDKLKMEKKLIEGYKDNFHNRYHIFNLGISYRFSQGG